MNSPSLASTILCLLLLLWLQVWLLLYINILMLMGLCVVCWVVVLCMVCWVVGMCVVLLACDLLLLFSKSSG